MKTLAIPSAFAGLYDPLNESYPYRILDCQRIDCCVVARKSVLAVWVVSLGGVLAAAVVVVVAVSVVAVVAAVDSAGGMSAAWIATLKRCG
jgi:hypothetical protein